MEEIIHIVRKWKNTDRYPCPKCGKKLSTLLYTCTPCDVKLKVKLNL